jgi:hypothetical protein
MRGGSPPPLHVDLPTSRELRARFFRGLAFAIAAAPQRTAAVVEVSTSQAVPAVWVSPPETVRPLLAAPAFAALELDLASVPGGGEVAAAMPGAAWALPPIASPGPPAPAATLWDVPGQAALLGTGGRLEVQTFWLSGRIDGRLWVARRARFASADAEELEARRPAVAAFVAAEWSRATGVLCRPRALRRVGTDWATAAGGSFARHDWLAVPPPIALRTAEPTLPEGPPTAAEERGHTIVLGSTGAGKTTYLADRAARAIRSGIPVVVVDLHGDLSPAIVARLGPADRARLVAVDASRAPVVGIAALQGADGRSAAQFVAAIKRLSPDGGDVYWGFRLERIFDAFVRLVQEGGGDLGDLYSLLTDADRRDAARLATRTPELARFLDELGPVLRRNPEFLWSAAARLAKVVLVPELAGLLAPADGGVPVEEVLEARRSLLVRIPFSVLGPESASFAGSLVAARVYLGRAGRCEPGTPPAPVLLVLDEVHGLSPRLVSEMLAEGRKFGVRCLVASQYPERLAPELRLAAAGVGQDVVVFRVPPAAAPEVGAWLGLPRIEAGELLPDLPVGLGLSRVGGGRELRTVRGEWVRPAGEEDHWSEAVEATRQLFPPSPAPDTADQEAATERLLLAALAAEERGTPLPAERWVEEASRLAGAPLDPAVLDDRRTGVERGGLVSRTAEGVRLTLAGERQLGLRASTGATRESAEHRALLLRAFRLFARQGHRLEIVRQGRFDTTLPDALFRQLPEPGRARSPRELAAELASAQARWAWRFFGGLDVHVEAEVSGALRADRIRHGWEKARRRGAFALFVVGDAERASRVRRVLRSLGVGPDRAQVWTLSPRGAEGRTSPPDGKVTDRCARA